MIAPNTAGYPSLLLKNENHTLPLSKNLSTILVTGPSADNLEVLLGNYNGLPSKYVTVLQGIKNKVGSHTRILYEPACGLIDQVPVKPVPPGYFILPNGSGGEKGLKAEYYKDTSLSGNPVVTKVVEGINENWDYANPVDGLPADYFPSGGRGISHRRFPASMSLPSPAMMVTGY
jgi:beta-glucosidase